MGGGIMIMNEWSNENKDRIKERILEFEPMCIKCGYKQGHLHTNINGTLCPKCNYSMVDSACQLLEKHFEGYDVPLELMHMFKQGIKETGI